MKGLRLTALVALTAVPASAQVDSAGTRRLAPVRVTVTRDAPRSSLDLPYSLARLSMDSARTGARRGSLTDLLITVPGLVASNRHNPTQDPRVAVRGFGARSAFGIRGLRVIRDGVPLTLADGQAAIDFVDLESVGSAEVLRGAAGALYGNASGGVLDLRSEPLPQDAVTWRGRATWNEDAQRLSARVAGGRGPWGWQATGTRNTADGPRDYARFRSTGLLADVSRRLGESTLRTQLTWYDAPLGENPGAITAAELATTPMVADPQSVTRKASKTVSQKLLSLVGEHPWSEGRGSATASVFTGLRELYNPQAFAVVGFDRRVLGANVRVQHGGVFRRHQWRLAVGADVQSQRDDRRNFAVCAGVTPRPPATCPGTSDQGVETIHQLERVTAGGVFARGEVTRSILSITGTLRADNTNFTVRDRRSTTGTILSRTMGAVTPMFGVTVRPRPGMSVYGNIASSFETPTTTEMANQPDGQGGINRELQPQRGRTLEAGMKGLLAGRLLYDVALFRIRTTDELIPFEIPNSGGRRYFRNAGETSRTGAELGLTATFGAVDLGASVARLTYTYEEFRVGTTVLDGKRVPGVSPTTASFFATGRRPWGFLTLEAQQGARAAADDANVTWAPGWVVWNARGGLTSLALRGVEPVVGVENLFDRTYVANVVTNATRGRFYEPGAGRRVYLGLGIRSR
ncbi:MAG: TonB-dependent receptor [Gemmatimonadetes bacterium]|nr:TonB-dependent receptor [Gemmatimonadota bacterium]